MYGFDAAGAWVDTDGIDSSSTLPSGQEVHGPAGLSQALADDPAFVACVADLLSSYALGRIPSPTERTGLARLGAELAADRASFYQILRAIVRSDAFQHGEDQR